MGKGVNPTDSVKKKVNNFTRGQLGENGEIGELKIDYLLNFGNFFQAIFMLS